MIEKEVILFVRGEQQFDGVDPDQTELISEGLMTIDDGGAVRLSYQETELTGMEGTTTSFLIEGDRATLTRSGTVTSQMVFQPGQPHSSLYNTPWGALTVDIVTTRLAHRLTGARRHPGYPLLHLRGASGHRVQPCPRPGPGKDEAVI